MEIFQDIIPQKDLCMALGYFDGVHLGHKKVIESAVNFAKKINQKSAVITFKEHPCCYLWGVKPEYILQKEKRIEYIEKLGIDFLYLLDFNKIKNLDGKEYIENILYKNFQPKYIVTGFNHNFGANKSGNTDLLDKYTKIFGYKYEKISPVKMNDEVISSSIIRKYLQDSKIEKANEMLGKEYSISGKVIKGNELGRTIGFPTANVEYPDNLIKMPYGCYKTNVKIGDNIYKSITNVGVKPTVEKKSAPLLETHILNFDKDIYGQEIEIFFGRFIRPEKKFKSIDELKSQIISDINIAL